MEETIVNYMNGDTEARGILIGDIMDLHNYDITVQEAEILLYKKYGKAKII